jgi:hypothetical protein
MNSKAAAPRPVEAREPRPDELTCAYQVHTLVQMLYARLALTHAWAPTVPGPYPQVLH